MPHGQRIFIAALAFSLLAHLIAAGSVNEWWTAPGNEIPFPVEARLIFSAQPAAEPAAVQAKAPAYVPAVNSLKTNQPPSQPETPVSTPKSEPEPAVMAQNQVSASVPPVEPLQEQAVAVSPTSSPVAVSPAPPPRVLRNLPERIALRYTVQSGEEGFILGRTTYSGQMSDGRYSLTSVTEATGVVSLFLGGKIIQASKGQITEHGLQPELYWNAKGERAQSPVSFDWPRQRLVLPTGEVDLPAQTQDLMSFPFHLAMLVRDEDAAWELPVTNGRKLRNYHFQVIGRESLTTGSGHLETLRLQGSRNGEGSLDVWLAPTQHWLPVRIRTQDQKGKVILLTLQDGTN